jgi:hypothetical protein
MQTTKKKVTRQLEPNYPNIKRGDIVETITVTEENYQEFAKECWRGYEIVTTNKLNDYGDTSVMAKWKKHSMPEWNFDFVKIGATYIKADADPINPARGKAWYRLYDTNALNDIDERE